MGAEVHISRRATEETGGAYGVPLNESHLEELVMGHAPPPPALVRPCTRKIGCRRCPAPPVRVRVRICPSARPHPRPCSPPPIRLRLQAESTAASLVRMGFPKRVPAAAPDYLCAGARGDFVCPRCQVRSSGIETLSALLRSAESHRQRRWGRTRLGWRTAAARCRRPNLLPLLLRST